MMIKKFISVTVVFVLIFSFVLGINASAITKTDDYQYDENFHSIPGPKTYTASRVIYGRDMGVDGLTTPSDIFVDENKNIYIADSGNNRIVVLNSDYKLIRIIKSVSSPDKKNELSDPKGVFAKDGFVYICDTGNFRVISVDSNNNVVRIVKGKDLMSVNKNFVFKPEKVVVDSNSNILVASTAVYQGIMRFDGKDKFKAFFAPNQVETGFATFVTSLLKKLFTDAQKESLQKNLPSPYSNLYIDNENFVYATAENVKDGQNIKKLNSSGTNILAYSSALEENQTFGDYEADDTKINFADIHCDKNGYMLAADSATQKLFLYDKECNLISIFGGSGDSESQFSSISAIEKLDDDYLILDSENGTLTVLSPNSYMRQVIVALNYYQNGEYDKCEEIWKSILDNNSNFPFAYKSLGRTQYHLGNYKLSMKYLKTGGDTYFYSLALNEYRKEFVKEHFAVLLFGIIIFVVLFVFAVKKIKKFLLSK